MMNRRTLLSGACALVLTAAVAQQGEAWQALRQQPRASGAPMTRAGDLNEFFIYLYASQTLPVVDDFSIDRTRHLDARSTDTDVTLIETIHRLQIAGSPTPLDLYATDTSYRFIYDPVLDISTRVPNPALAVERWDISTYPPPDTADVFLWPAYTLLDTIGDPEIDTVRPPQFTGQTVIQDSLLVYEVAALTSTYINPDNTPRPLILWQEDEAYINGTYPIDPPSIGVASLDGMDRTGFPYQPENPNLEGIADHLTSVPIDLNGIALDSVYLSFFYQARGLSGDAFDDPADSLRLEFYAPQEENWYLEWSTPYEGGTPPFKQVMIPIKLDKFLKNGFQMRFSSRATLGGPVDHWHIDYVRLGKQRNHTDTLLQDVTIVYPANSLLENYTSVPYDKFQEDPALYMAPDVELTHKNLRDGNAFVTWSYGVSTDCGTDDEFLLVGNNISAPAGQSYTAVNPINSAPINYTYDLSGCSDAAFATSKFWITSSPNALQYNDTTTVLQEISNYYSYDDGSAEQSYFFLSECIGCKLAYRFVTQGQDSLRALRMYFDPIFSYDIFNDPRDGSFRLAVWGADLNAEPIFTNETYHSPEYNLWGPNKFVEYAFDDTVLVSGTFHVGLIQANGTKIHLGLDRNRINNQHMFYNVGNGWDDSSAPGSWMIRPVMMNEVDPFVGLPEQSTEGNILLFPNPAADELSIRMEGDALRQLELVDMTGRVVARINARNGAAVDITGVKTGVYLVRALDGEGRSICQRRLVVQR